MQYELMKSRLMYVELKSGFNDDGPAWIGMASFSKTGRTIYFNGRAFQSGSLIGGNHYELGSGEVYWISGVKKDGADRHWAGSGKIKIDKAVISKYLAIIKEDELPKNKFEVVELNNIPPKELVHEITNRKV